MSPWEYVILLVSVRIFVVDIGQGVTLDGKCKKILTFSLCQDGVMGQN